MGIKNGTLDCTKSNSYGSVCIVECDNGYNVKGSKSVTCSSKGDWVTTNGDLPSCNNNFCPNKVRTSLRIFFTKTSFKEF